MTRLRNVGGKITETTGGNETLYAGKDIVYNASKAINFKGTNGIKFGKPEKRTDLKVTKVEGPFDDKGKLLTEIRAGQGYTYKATPSRTPTKSEVQLVKWAVKLDDGQILEIKGAGVHNQLAEGKIIVSATINAEFKKARVYAYFNKPDEGVSVSATGKNKYPMLVLQGTRRKGMNRQNTGPALDMLSKDYTEDAAGFEKLRNEMYGEVYDVEPQSSFYNITSRADNAKYQSDAIIEKVKQFCKKTDTELFDIFRNDIKNFSMGKLQDAAVAMVDKMQSNSGGEYKNDNLTNAAIDHGNSKAFISAIKGFITDYVKENKGDITKLEITDDSTGVLYPKMKNVSSPKFPDKLTGLGITINDVWAYQVFVTSYIVNGNNFEMKLEYDYLDHFGLDFPDIQKYDYDIFYSWFVLQHFRGYKPFITKLEIIGPLKGTF